MPDRLYVTIPGTLAFKDVMEVSRKKVSNFPIQYVSFRDIEDYFYSSIDSHFNSEINAVRNNNSMLALSNTIKRCIENPIQSMATESGQTKHISFHLTT